MVAGCELPEGAVELVPPQAARSIVATKSKETNFFIIITPYLKYMYPLTLYQMLLLVGMIRIILVFIVIAWEYTAKRQFVIFHLKHID